MERAHLLLIAAVLAIAGLTAWLLGGEPRTVAVPGGTPETEASSGPGGQGTAPVSVSPQRMPTATAAADRPSPDDADAAAANAPVEDARPHGRGRLSITVLQEQGGAPRPGVRLRMRREREHPGRESIYTDLAYGTEQELIVTGELGEATFDLPSGVPFVLSAWVDPNGAGYRELEVAPLTRDEWREETIVWRREVQRLVVQQRVLDLETRRPVRDAVVTLRSRGRTLAVRRTGLGGLFAFPLETTDDVYVRVEHPEHTPALQDVGRLEELLPQAREDEGSRVLGLPPLVLNRVGSAQLIATNKLGAGVACEGAITVSPRVLFRGDQTRFEPGWERFDTPFETFGSGRVLLEGLPLGVPLTVRVTGPCRTRVQAESLVPDEVGEIQVVLPGPGVLVGRLLTSGRVPVSGQEVWIRRGRTSSYLSCAERGGASAVTGADGRFRIALDQGDWVVGPSPACPPQPPFPSTTNPQELAPFAEHVYVPGDEEVELELVLDTGLYLHGRVLRASGLPELKAQVEAVAVEHGQRLRTRADEAGRFVLGPLRDEPFRLWASAATGGARSEELLKRPRTLSDEALTLQLEPVGAYVAGVVVEEGTGRAPNVTVVAESATHRATTRVDLLLGSFVFEDLPPGNYALRVEDTALSPPPHRLPLAAREVVRGVVLEVPQVATLRVETGRYGRMTVEVWRNELRYVKTNVEFIGHVYVPAGRVRVVGTTHANGIRVERFLDVTPWDDATLVLDE